ncbi:MAG TPA: hypothetical protein EYP17_02750 [Candidatus Latescibacteria bacterium]|nr:hypothetical protein [Candidatus Latescibacterota bacterium]
MRWPMIAIYDGKMAQASKEEINRTLSELKGYGINTIHVYLALWRPDPARYDGTKLKPGWEADEGKVASSRYFLEKAHKLDIEVHVPFTPLSTSYPSQIPLGSDVFCRDLYGRLDWKWACPNNPDVRERARAFVEELFSIYEIDGVILDFIRFREMAVGTNKYNICFCPHCHAKAEQLGYDLGRLRAGVRRFVEYLYNLPRKDLERFLSSPMGPGDFLLDFSFRFPEVLKWLHFRCESIAEVVGEFYNVVKEVSGGRGALGANTYEPLGGSSYLVGQDYRSLVPYLDYFEPMVYYRDMILHPLGSVVSILARNPEVREEEVLRAYYRIFHLGEYEKPSTVGEILSAGGFPAGIVYAACRKVREMVGPDVRVCALLYTSKDAPHYNHWVEAEVSTRVDADFIVECVRMVKEAGLFSIGYFTYQSTPKEWLRAAVQAWRGE